MMNNSNITTVNLTDKRFLHLARFIYGLKANFTHFIYDREQDIVLCCSHNPPKAKEKLTFGVDSVINYEMPKIFRKKFKTNKKSEPTAYLVSVPNTNIFSMYCGYQIFKNELDSIGIKFSSMHDNAATTLYLSMKTDDDVAAFEFYFGKYIKDMKKSKNKKKKEIS